MRNFIFYQNLSEHIFTPNNRFTKLFLCKTTISIVICFVKLKFIICIDHINLYLLCAKHFILLSCNPSKYRTMTDELNDVEI